MNLAGNSALLLVIHAAATWYMVGLIWFVQVVHYPLMLRVGGQEIGPYEVAHQRLTTWVVGPAMLIEAGVAALLVVLRPAGVPAGWVWAGLGALLLIWLSTAFLQVPQHVRLEHGFCPIAHRRLVRSNWIRTLLWSGRGVLAGWLLLCSTYG